MESPPPEKKHAAGLLTGMGTQYIIAFALSALLIFMASIDLLEMYLQYSHNTWFTEYRDAVLSGSDMWQLGYRAEP